MSMADLTESAAAPPRTRRLAGLRRFAGFRIIVGGSLLLGLLVCALAAPWLAPFSPQEMDFLNTLVPPIWAQDPAVQMPGAEAYLLGTDSLGRDVLSNLIYGARTALYVAVVGGVCTMLLGGVLGLVSAYVGGWFDRLVVALTNLWMCFPPIVLSMILIVALGAGVNNIIIALVLVDWTRFCRVVRVEALVAMQRDYIPAARLLGFGAPRIVFGELLPAVAHIGATLLTLEMGIAVIVEAVLSFAGMGVEAHTPAWGQMIADARLYLYQNIWSMLLPVGCIFVTVLACNLLGDGLRHALDPRNRGMSHGR